MVILPGAIYLMLKTLNEVSMRRIGGHTILLTWIIVTFMIISYFFHRNWDRYYIHFIICSSTLIGFSIISASKALKWLIPKSRARIPGL